MYSTDKVINMVFRKPGWSPEVVTTAGFVSLISGCDQYYVFTSVNIRRASMNSISTGKTYKGQSWDFTRVRAQDLGNATKEKIGYAYPWELIRGRYCQ